MDALPGLQEGWGFNWFQRYFLLQWHLKLIRGLFKVKIEFLLLFSHFSVQFSSKSHWMTRQERKPHKHFYHFMWNSLPYQFRLVGWDVMKEMWEKSEGNLFEWIKACLRYAFKSDGKKSFSEKWKNIIRQLRL